MANVSAGQTANSTIPAGSVWRVTSTGEGIVKLLSGASGAGFTAWRVTPDKPANIGPYNTDAVISLTGVSGLTSDGAEPSAALPPAQVAAVQAATSGGVNQWMASGGVVSRTLKRMTDAVGVAAANSGTAATVSIDAASPFGRPAYKVAMPAGNTYHEVQLAGLNIAQFDGHVIWTVWVEDYTAVQQIQAFAGTSGYSRFYQQTHGINNNNTNRINGEHRIVVGALAAGVTNTFVAGTDTLADTKLRIFPGAAGANVWVDAVYVPSVGRATHVITHDDCSVTWINNALPYLAANGLTGAFGVNSGDIGGSASLYLSAAQVQQIAAAGHVISPHNVTNTSLADGSGGGTQTVTQYAADFVTASNALAALIGNSLDTTYHPWVQGRTNQAAMDALRAQGLRIARGTDPGYNFPQVGSGGHVLQLKAQSLHLLTQAQIAAVVANAKKYGATICWMVHEVTAAGGAGVETAVANYAYMCGLIGADVASGAAVCRTPKQLAREMYSERLVSSALLA